MFAITGDILLVRRPNCQLNYTTARPQNEDLNSEATLFSIPCCSINRWHVWFLRCSLLHAQCMGSGTVSTLWALFEAVKNWFFQIQTSKTLVWHRVLGEKRLIFPLSKMPHGEWFSRHERLFAPRCNQVVTLMFLCRWGIVYPADKRRKWQPHAMILRRFW